MKSITYLALAYFGMIVAVGIWTFIVAQRHDRLNAQLESIQHRLNHLDEDKDDEESQ